VIQRELSRVELLDDNDEFLPSRSHKRVLFRCKSCEETFLREYKYQEEKHGCERSGLPKVEFKILEEGAKVPTRAKATDAGYDVASIEAVELLPGKMTAVQTGVALSAPDGYYFTIEGRSSMFKKQVFPVRAIIDSSYCGQFIVVLANFGSEPVFIAKGDRVAQLVIHKFVPFDLLEVETFSPEYSQRGLDGFGSTGV